MPLTAVEASLFLAVGIAFGVIVNICYSYFLSLNGKNLMLNSRRLDMNSKQKNLLLKGRCGSNGAKANRLYLLTILANGVLYVIVYMANGINLMSICYCLMTSAFLVISTVDWLTYEIPLPCNLFLGGLGIIVCIFDYGNIVEHLIGAVAISGVLYLLFVLSKGAAIGGGDVKLMAAGGLILGWKLGILAFLLGCIIGAVCHVIRMKVAKADRVLAMGPYLSIGLYCCALWGNNFLSWYFKGLVQ